MSKLKKERLNQMIENALSYEQVKPFYSDLLFKKFKDSILKPSVYSLTFASVLISFIFIPPILISKDSVDIDKVNDYITFAIIEDF